MLGQCAQVAGSLLILVPFGPAQLGRPDPHSRRYLLLNPTFTRRRRRSRRRPGARRPPWCASC